ncbi:MAG: 5'-nucleotidase C-terminal domain-containing protein [Bacillales bacterium]|nr:5'-nucleotidase C-terminal domain-containing protein [Bacillales bacterium]
MNSKSKSFRKLMAAAFTASMMTQAVVSLSPVSAKAEGKSFSDVLPSHYFYEAVSDLTGRGIISGFKDDTFRPSDHVTRAQAAKILALALGLEVENVSNPGFKDVKKGDWFYGPVAALVKAGVLDGFEDGTFKPNEKLTRAQMAKMMTLGFHFNTKIETKNPFTDVKERTWYAPYVLPLFENKVTTGITNTTFAPNQFVNRGQMAAFVFRSEKALKASEPVEIQSKIINVTNHSIELESGTYPLTEDLKSWLNPSNLTVLKGAKVTLIVKKSKIEQILSLEITSNGKKSEDSSNPYANHFVFDGKNSTFNGKLIVNGDFIAIKNFTIKGDFEIGKGVESSLYTENMTVEGKTMIQDSAAAKRASVKNVNHFYPSISFKKSVADDRAAEGTPIPSPVLVFANVNMPSIEVSKNGITIEAKGSTKIQEISLSSNVILKADNGSTIPKVSIKEGASQVTIDALIERLQINTTQNLTVNGKGSIKNVAIESGKEVSLETEGKIEKIETKSKESTISIGNKTKVGDIVAPDGSNVKDVIKNYDQVKEHIEKIGGKDNLDAKPTTPPMSGGGGSNGGGSKPNDRSPFKLTVMHTNDTHAHLDNIAKRITAIKQVRQTNPNSLLLDAGDVFTGTLYFNEFNGLADLEFMNLAGYDAMTFGNHEFDKGTATLATFVKNAKFPFVSANVDFSKDANLKGRFNNGLSSNPKNGNIYNEIIKDVNGEKIGIFGLTTAETKVISSPGEDVAFEDYIEEAEKAVKALEAQRVNKIIAITHIGFNDGGGDNDLTLAKKVEGIDVIVGGHSHDKLAEPVVDETGEEPTIIVQANEYSKYLGTLDVEFDKSGKIIGYAGKLIDIDKKVNNAYELQDDPEAAQILETKYKPTVVEKQNTVVGQATVDLIGGNPPARVGETNLGNLIADGMLAKAKTINPDTVIALQNGGGIRATVPAGNISLAKILEVMPFGNSLGLMRLTGAEIKEALEFSVKDVPKPFGGFLQISGMKFTYDSRKPAGERVLSVDVKEGGNYVPLDPRKTYVVATNIFTAKGGDGYTMFKKAYEEGRVSEPGYVDWEMFRDYIAAQPNHTVNPSVEGRIIDVAAIAPVNAADFSGTAQSPKVHDGNVSVDVTGVSKLEYATVKGDLYLKGNTEIVLDHVTVEGETYFLD